ncbi:hypothetical protein F2P81_011948 [Scophthalmus maximus]|uniref:Uncharacterized protein n=1 Tax=Scophthalmus maximus TaxID=52904 RepID=A0A6A4SN92_SCOMX|nr:hypothetical protein F2P81_011948 [Scophthalmus maximus]
MRGHCCDISAASSGNVKAYESLGSLREYGASGWLASSCGRERNANLAEVVRLGLIQVLVEDDGDAGGGRGKGGGGTCGEWVSVAKVIVKHFNAFFQEQLALGGQVSELLWSTRFAVKHKNVVSETLQVFLLRELQSRDV